MIRIKYLKYVKTPFGCLLLESENGLITGVRRVLNAGTDHSCPALEKASEALSNYISGKECNEPVPVYLSCTPFQLTVYKEVSKIPAGKTASYGEIAERIGKKGASRAVGNALNKNPVLIFIPCHRVIGKDKALTGFAGGLEMKKMLLEHERNYFMNSSAICTAFVAAPFLT